MKRKVNCSRSNSGKEKESKAYDKKGKLRERKIQEVKIGTHKTQKE